MAPKRSDGKALAWHALGCGDPQRPAPTLGLESSAAGLVVHTTRHGHCGAVSEWLLLDGALRPLYTTETAIDRQCGNLPHQQETATVEVVDAHTLRVTRQGQRVGSTKTVTMVNLSARSSAK